MKKYIIVFASMSGNTEEMADLISESIREEGIDLTVTDVLEADPSDLEEYDGILLGAYTWGDGDLPDEFFVFYDEMDGLNLTGKKAAVFGSCDSSYPAYGAAVDILMKKLQDLGADIVLEGLKVELDPIGEDEELCKKFGKDFVSKYSIEVSF
ncbi:flavodoxin [Alteribacillus bidgolensis]|uniref:Flavodoxin n=1 Tax=Alteribacillus bidgolensis TaxID=930129 RepID=A0A1G8QQQ0_9BACI|nr:flavodoxin [Alteribacillus bidgolensis]SDJ06685.1 flavodoxin I [Alteribacillus bidgolensis]